MTAAAFSDDGAALAAADPAGINVLRAADGTEIGSFETDGVRALAVSGDGRSSPRRDRRRRRLADARGWSDVVFEDGTATALALSSDSSRLAIGTAKDGIGS